MIALYLFAAFAVLMLFLYRQGFAVSKCVRAVLFVFQRGKWNDSVSLNSCTGWVRHRVPIRHAQTYEFCLDCQLSQGEAEVILLGPRGQELLRLNRTKTAGSVDLNGDSPYTLRWEFSNATGKCQLRWQEIPSQ